MLFPEPSVAEGHSTTSAPVFLSGEKRQAVRTSTPIPPVTQLVLESAYSYEAEKLPTLLRLDNA